MTKLLLNSNIKNVRKSYSYGHFFLDFLEKTTLLSVRNKYRIFKLNIEYRNTVYHF